MRSASLPRLALPPLIADDWFAVCEIWPAPQPVRAVANTAAPRSVVTRAVLRRDRVRNTGISLIRSGSGRVRKPPAADMSYRQ
ncbi:Uncharacterised protein [Mycobacteroides abscessus subsp. massiliense]|nr:Uncharacterised protein [Mycobacteroides abscessus subsp. massiliense]